MTKASQTKFAEAVSLLRAKGFSESKPAEPQIALKFPNIGPKTLTALISCGLVKKANSDGLDQFSARVGNFLRDAGFTNLSQLKEVIEKGEFTLEGDGVRITSLAYQKGGFIHKCSIKAFSQICVAIGHTKELTPAHRKIVSQAEDLMKDLRAHQRTYGCESARLATPTLAQLQSVIFATIQGKAIDSTR